MYDCKALKTNQIIVQTHIVAVSDQRHNISRVRFQSINKRITFPQFSYQGLKK